MLKQLFIPCLLFGLVACGGGSGGDSNTRSSSRLSSVVSSLPASSLALSSSSSLISSAVPSANSSNPASSTSSVSTSSSTLLVPRNVSATPGNTAITLDWDTVTNATGYHIYYASEANILPANINSFDDGTRIENVMPPYVINSLENGKTYYLVVTAINGGTESAPSIEVNTTPLDVELAKQPTAQEVLILELINRARANPTAEAARYNIGLNDGITDDPISTDPKPPLAHNLFLIDAARQHSQWMLDNGVFDHTGVNGSSPWDRMRDAGYTLSGTWTAGENIAWGGTGGSTIDLTAYAISHHERLFKSPGHRKNILGSGYREVGIGQKRGSFFYQGNNWLASMLTEAFARSGNSYFLNGVVYNDANNNDFYDVGEGLSGITVSINGEGHGVFSTGAYSIPLSNGTYNLTITGDALGSPVFHTVQINNANVKVNVIKSGSDIDVATW